MSNYQVVKLEESAWSIEEEGVRSFLFCGTKSAMLVDTGYGPGDLAGAVRGLTDLPVVLVNTHTDPDHVGCNMQFEAVHMHPAEYDRYSEYGHAIRQIPLWEGAAIDIGGRVFEVILIPGHTPGSIVLLDRKNRVLISGDSIQAGRIYMFGKGRNLPAFVESLKKLSEIAGEIDIIYPSHGPMPLKADMISGLLTGALAMMDGQVSPTPSKAGTKDVLAYDVGAAVLLLPQKNA